MAMGVMEVASVTRVQDYTTIKQNEDNKAAFQQSNIVRDTRKEEDRRATEVTKRDETAWHRRNPDAKQKGHNEYSGDGGRRRRQQSRTETEAAMDIDGREIHTGFDFKI